MEKAMTISREQALRLVAAAAMVTALAGNAYAGELSFDFALSNGTQSASANFTFSADNELAPVTLRIELTNTMESNGGPNWLTGLFFNLAESPTLIYDHESAPVLAPDGMITLEGTNQTPYTLAEPANFWAYRDDLSGELPFGDQQYGLGAAGLDVFGLANILEVPPDSILPQPAGSDGGILANIEGLSVPPGHEGRPFVLGSLVFEFSLGEGFVLSQAGVSDIAFIFGTGFDEVVLIPLPLPVAMAGAGLMIVVCFRRRLVALAGR
jgi:hypothetical protein